MESERVAPAQRAPSVWGNTSLAAAREAVRREQELDDGGEGKGGVKPAVNVSPGRSVAAAAAREVESSSRPIVGYIRGPNDEWIAQREEEAAKEAAAAAGAKQEQICGVGKDASGQHVVGFGSVVLPAAVAFHRLVLCGLAVGLLWATSLSVARHFTSQFVTAPPLTRVVDACNDAYIEVQRQRKMQLSCVQRQLTHCQVELAAATAAETSRSKAEGLFNRQLVVEAITLQQRCEASQLQSLSSLEKLQEAGVTISWRANVCSASELERAQAIVGDIGQAKTHAMEVAQNYAHGAQTLQLIALAGLDERVEYDAAYLEAKQAKLAAVPEEIEQISSEKLEAIQQSLDALNASLAVCSASSDAEQCELPLAEQVAQMREQYELLHEAYEEQRHEILEYERSVQASVAAVQPSLQAAQEVISQVDPSFHIATLDMPELQLTDVTLEVIPTTEEMEAEMRAYKLRQQERAGVYIDQAKTDASDWADEVGLSTADMDALLSDYDPPPVNTSEQRAAMDAMSDQFLEEQEAALDAFAAVGERVDNLTSGGGANQSLVLPDLGETGLLGLTFEPLHGADVDVDLLSLALDKVVWVATAADLTWRAYRSVRLIAKYWSKAALAVPPLDLRDGAAAHATLGALCRACAVNPCQMVTQLCLSPATGLVLVAGALFLVANAATALYVPAYLHYVQGCVEPPRNGTVFANNLYSVAYNYAASDGNQALLEGLDDFHSTLAANCSAELRDSAREQQGAQRELEAAVDAHLSASDDMRLLRRCLDLDALSAASLGHGDENAEHFTALDLMLHSSACEVRLANASLHTAIYNCSALPDCVPTCDGPSRQVTGTLCKRCGCHAEWLMHGMVLQILLALFVFLCINVWRVFLVDGLCRLLWRELVAGQFEFMATCDERGHANVGRRDLRAALKAALRGTVAMGWAMLALSFSINVPWVLALQYVGTHLNVASQQPGAVSMATSAAATTSTMATHLGAAGQQPLEVPGAGAFG